MSIFKKIAIWAEKNSFWADTIRSSVFGIVGALLIATIIEIVKNDVEFTAEKDKARLSLKVFAIRDFAEKSYKFTSLAVRYKIDNSQSTNLRDDYDNYRSSQNLLDILLNDSNISKKTQHIADEMLKIINYKKNDLSDSEKFEIVRDSIKNESYSLEVYALKEKL